MRLGDESDEDSADNARDEDDVLGLRVSNAKKRAPPAKKKQAEWTPLAIAPRSHYLTPYEQLDNRRVVSEMKRTILFQDEALCELSKMLLMVHAANFFINPTGGSPLRNNIHARILSGPSGVGKTETVLLLRRLLGMQDGEPNAAQFIHIDASVYNDVTQLNRLCGSGPGYAGSEHRTSLVDDLRRAIETPELRALSELSPRSKDYQKHVAHYRHLKESGQLQYQRIIFLFIDEIDKAHVNFMTVINGLLDSGLMKSSRSDPFVLPRQTQLIVLFTSNFGDKNIERMKTRDPVQAARFVEEAMREKGLASNSIERFGGHVIFFPVSEANLGIIVQKNVKDMMQSNTQLTEKYGVIDCAQAVQCIVDFVKQVSSTERGVRNTMKNLYLCLQPLLIQSFYALEHMSSTSTCKQLHLGEKTLQLFMETLHVGMFEEGAPLDEPLGTSGLNARALIQCVLDNEWNQSALERYRQEGQSQLIRALGVSQADRLVNCLLMPLIAHNYAQDANEKEHDKEFLQFSDDSDGEEVAVRKRPASQTVDQTRMTKKLRYTEEEEEARVVELECNGASPLPVEVVDKVMHQRSDVSSLSENGPTEYEVVSDDNHDEEMLVEPGAATDLLERLCIGCNEPKHVSEFERMVSGRRRKDGSRNMYFSRLECCIRCFSRQTYQKRKAKGMV
jgi:hypothetical protein